MKFLKVVLEIVLAIMAVLCAYGIVKSLEKRSKEPESSYEYGVPYQEPYTNTQKPIENWKKNRGKEIGRVYPGGPVIYEFSHEGHTYIMSSDYGMIHSASCPCDWINKL